MSLTYSYKCSDITEDTVKSFANNALIVYVCIESTENGNICVTIAIIAFLTIINIYFFTLCLLTFIIFVSLIIVS